MSDEARLAAEGRMQTWKGHDLMEEDVPAGEQLCYDGAYQLFDTLTEADEDELDTAARMVKDAFKISDYAEEQQGYDKEREEQLYNQSTRLLKEARDQVGLKWKPMEERGNGWWKDFRRDDYTSLFSNLYKELEKEQNSKLAAISSTYRHFRAMIAHNEDNWDKVKEQLTPHYRKFDKNSEQNPKSC